MVDLSQSFKNAMEKTDEPEKDSKMTELQNLIQKDSQLPSDIRLDNIKPAKKYSEIQTVLLIGVTGMLGPYILRDLMERPQIKKIYCLIRKTKEEMKERLRERLEATGVIEEVDFSKIICVNGDICFENLGVSGGEYEALSEEIDAVVHLGIKADYTGEYSREPGNDSIRTVNVLGTLNLLKFVVNKKLKCVFAASSLSCAFKSIGSTSFSEDWQDPDTFQEVNFNIGYRISRFISEQLFKQAIELGVPVKVFRFGLFGGDSKGRSDYTSNQYSLAWLSVLKLGYFPNLSLSAPILPVDTYSKLAINLFFNPEAPSDVYNVCMKRNPPVNKAVVEISKEFGVKVRPVSVRKFVEKVDKSGKLPMSHGQVFYFAQRDTVFKDLFNGRLFKRLKKVLEEVDVIYENSKTAKYIPNINDVDDTEESMRRDLKFLEGAGAFEKYGVVQL